MKTMIQFGTVIVAVFLLTIGEASARGGGGGGRGGGGGGARGGGGYGGGMSRPSPSVSRSPAVSQPVSRPAAPAVSRPATPSARPATPAARPATPSVTRPSAPSAGRPSVGGGPAAGTRPSTGARPSRSDLENFLDMPQASTGAGSGARPGGANLGAAAAAGVAGGAAAEFLQGRGGEGRPGVADRAAGGEKRPADGRGAERRGDLAGSRPERIENRGERQQNRTERRDEIRNQMDDQPLRDFWSDHPLWGAWAITRPFRWATWGALTGWVGYGWSESTPYAYGDNVYYQDDSVYYGDQAVATAEEYAQQAEQIAASAPEVAADKAEWMPLGVFAMTPDGQASGPAPTLFLQLAISKEGIIAGTFNNSATNETQTIEGMADKESQRAAWNVAGQRRPIMETGIVNLTEDAAPALIHFADGTTQQWLLVRLAEPAAKQ